MNLQLMHQYVQGFLPKIFNETWITNRERRNRILQGSDAINDQFVLRNSESLFIPFARLSSSARQPLINLPKLWGEFENFEIKIIRDKIELKIKLKRFLLESLSSTINCNRLFCPSCHLSAVQV